MAPYYRKLAVIVMAGLISFILTGYWNEIPAHVSADHSIPFVSSLEFTAIPDRSQYSIGKPIQLNVVITNVSKNDLKIDGTPFLRLGTMTDDLTRHYVESIPLTWLADKTLLPGQRINHAEPVKHRLHSGWYQVSFENLDYKAGDGTGSRMGGGGCRFFVQYPPHQVITATVTPNATIKVPGSKIIIERIEFSSRETKVYMHIDTTMKAPIGFQMTLLRTNGENDPGPLLGGLQKDNTSSGIDSVEEFQPTTIDNTSVTVEITEWDILHVGQGVQTLHGAWKVNIPI